MTIQFLGFPGCPNTPAMRENLLTALTLVRSTLTFEDVNQVSLPQPDIRRGWPAPTVLVNGRDLFGMSQPSGTSMRCRVYAGGVPTPVIISQRLRVEAELDGEVTQ